MAEVVLTRLVEVVIGTLVCSTPIEKGLDTLSKRLQRIQDLLADAEARQITDKSVKKWLGELKDDAYDVEDVLEEILYEALRWQVDGESNKGKRKQVQSLFPSCSCFGLKQIPFKLDMENRIEEFNERIEKIHVAGVRLSLREGDGRRASDHIDYQQPCTTSLLAVPEYEILGRDKDRDEIIKWLLSDDSCGEKKVSMISIVGMGGLGKTTLAQLVCNDQNVDNYFHIRAWIYVSEDFDVRRLTKEILESATRKSYNSSLAIDPMQCYLQDILPGKRFLIALDDVWNEDPFIWEMLRAPFSVGAKGSMVETLTQFRFN